MSNVSPVSNVSSASGNTKPTRDRSRSWCFTINNPEDNDIVSLSQAKDTFLIVAGMEKGKENETPHLQCYLESKNQVSFSTIKKLFPRAHIEKAKGNRKQNLTYCLKDGQPLINNFPEEELSIEEQILRDEYNNVVWRPWQELILNMIENKTQGDRKITWIYEKKGNTGKSFLAKFLVIKYNAIIGDGKKDNVFNQIKVWMDENKKSPELVVLDIPRENLDYVNYGAIEQIKGGCIYSGKYEGGRCIFKKPTIVIFANEPPKRGKWSEDREHIIEI